MTIKRLYPVHVFMEKAGINVRSAKKHLKLTMSILNTVLRRLKPISVTDIISINAAA